MAQDLDEEFDLSVHPARPHYARGRDDTAPNILQFCGLTYGHTMEEMGLSHWAPWWLLLSTRLTSASLILSMASPSFPFRDTTNIPFFIQATSFVLLALCSILADKGWVHTFLPSFVAPMYYLGIMLAILETPSVFEDESVAYKEGYGIIVPWTLFFWDFFAMRAQVRFWYSYTVISIAIFTIYYSFRSMFRVGSITRCPSLRVHFVLCVLKSLLAPVFVTFITRADILWCRCSTVEDDIEAEELRDYIRESRNSTS